MRIGIDFGTSYSAAAGIINGNVELVKFDGESQFRTSVFFPAVIPAIEDFVITPEYEREISALVAASRRDESENIRKAEAEMKAALSLPEEKQAVAISMIPKAIKRPEEDHRRAAVAAVRRQWLRREGEKAQEVIRDYGAAIYGEAAVEAYIRNARGHLISSPKSMLGYRLHGEARGILLGVVTNILSHIRITAQNQFNREIKSAVLGRPVKFRSSMGAAGTTQAIELLTEASSAAGFDDVDFMEEPIAAAWDYHNQAQGKAKVLIIDIGGGTTDVTLCEIGQGAGPPVVYQTWGLPEGGSDIDVELNMRAFMGLLGKDVTDTSLVHYYSAALVNDLPRQREFRYQDFSGIAAPFNSRLMQLQRDGNTVRLNRAAERTKIYLSERDSCKIGLSFIENGLQASVSCAQLYDAASAFLHRLARILVSIKNNDNNHIDILYLTGGMSNAPYVINAVREVFPHARLVRGNASLAVVSGLATVAAFQEVATC